MRSYNLIIDTTKRINPTYRLGETVDIEFTVYTDSTLDTEYDLTGCSVFAEIRQSPGATVLVDLLPEISDPATGGIITINVAIPRSITDHACQWDVLLQLANGDTQYLVKGKVRLDGSITDGEGSFVPGPTGRSIQEIVDASYSRGHAMLPKGNTAISATVVFSNKMGGVFQGHGNSQEVPAGHANEGSHSTLYRGSQGFTDALLKLRGSYTTLRDFCLIGNNNNLSLTGKSAAGIWISKESDAGTGSGKHHVQNVNIIGCTAGVQCGSSRTEGNCDTTVLEHMNFRVCDKGLYVKNEQGMSYTCKHLSWQNAGADTSSLFYFEAGGDLTAIQPDILSKCRILTLDQIYTGGNIGVGQNNAKFNFFGGKIDNNGLGTCLLEVKGAGKTNTPAKVTYTGLHIAGNSQVWGDILLYLAGGCDVTLNDCTINPDVEGTAQWNTSGDGSTRTTKLTVKHSRIAVTSARALLALPTSDGYLHYQFYDNKLTSGIVLRDWWGIVTGEA